MKRYFIKTKFKSKEGDWYWIYKPTIKKRGEGVVLISDNFNRKSRENYGNLDETFVVSIKQS